MLRGTASLVFTTVLVLGSLWSRRRRSKEQDNKQAITDQPEEAPVIDVLPEHSQPNEPQQLQEMQEHERSIPDDESCASDEDAIPDNRSDASYDSDCSDASGICLTVATSKPWGRKVSGLNMTAVSKTPTGLDQPTRPQQGIEAQAILPDEEVSPKQATLVPSSSASSSQADDDGCLPDEKSCTSIHSDRTDWSSISLGASPSKPWGRKVSGLNMTALPATPAAPDQPATSQQGVENQTNFSDGEVSPKQTTLVASSSASSSQGKENRPSSASATVEVLTVRGLVDQVPLDEDVNKSVIVQKSPDRASSVRAPLAPLTAQHDNIPSDDGEADMLLLHVVREVKKIVTVWQSAHIVDSAALEAEMVSLSRFVSKHFFAPVLPHLAKWALLQGGEALLIVRHLHRSFFDMDQYSSMTAISRAPSRLVCTCMEKRSGQEVVVKRVDLSTVGASIATRVIASTEAAIMTKLQDVEGMCPVYDFGVDSEAAYLVMPKYQGSMRAWRLQQPGFAECSTERTYLQLFWQATRYVQALHSNGIVHFDLKCDNILLDGWGEPKMHMALADFGSAVDFSNTPHKYIVRSRGTECIQPPEMLLMEAQGEARARKCPEPAAADIWSLGCLLFELCTGTMLFDADLFAMFHTMLTREDQELLPPEKVAQIAHLPQIEALLRFILVRDPLQRPSLNQILCRVQDILFIDYNVAFEDIGTKLLSTEDTCSNNAATEHTSGEDTLTDTTVEDPTVEGNSVDTIFTEEDVPVLEAPSRATTMAPSSSNSKGKSPVGRLMGFTPWKAVKGFGAAAKNVHWRSSLVL